MAILEAAFFGLWANRTLAICLVAWLVAQTLKVAHSYLAEGRLNFRRFVGAGGMPSAHSALVTSLATAVGLQEGWNAPVTALAVVFALIVMYDAAGVRYAAGRQAAVLNRIVDELSRSGRVREERLKELLGHTPVEVVIGALLGITIALWLGSR
ncbi:MAG: divergent PAP2 family protein [Bacillota bacterium]|nr:divergent PAP2 family protein [Bacillota bacterium]